jgi:hypothetical protein
MQRQLTDKFTCLTGADHSRLLGRIAFNLKDIGVVSGGDLPTRKTVAARPRRRWAEQRRPHRLTIFRHREALCDRALPYPCRPFEEVAVVETIAFNGAPKPRACLGMTE